VPIDVPNISPLPPPPAGEKKPDPLPPFELRLHPHGQSEPILPPLDMTERNPVVPALHVKVKQFRFKGNHRFTSSELHSVTKKYEGKEIGTEDLDAIRQALTLYYVSRGYINSGAILEDQDMDGGVVTYTIVEGRLTEIKLDGNQWFRDAWIRNQVKCASGTPLNYNLLREELQMLRQVPTVTRVNAGLAPGNLPGESILNLTVKDSQPFRVGIEADDRRPPSVGSEGLNLQVSDLNVTGNNDPLNVQYTIGHSVARGAELSGGDNYSVDYTCPVTPWSTTLTLLASKFDSTVVEQPFSNLDIASTYTNYTASLRQPLVSTLNREIALSLSAGKTNSESFLLGRPYSLSAGAVSGKTDDFVVRAALELTDRSPVHVLGLRSTFSLGLDAFDATINDTNRDGRFFSWLGQVQYVRRLFETDNLLVIRINGQLSNDPLFSLEQFAIGGMDSVRGYRERDLLRDDGVFGSVELRIPLWRNHEHSPVLALAPFFDVATGWNVGTNDISHDTLESAGIGLLLTPCSEVSAQFYWGYGFNRPFVQENGSNLQDKGLHFAIRVAAF